MDDDDVLGGSLTRSQTLIVLESMPSTRSIPAIRSLGLGGWVSHLFSEGKPSASHMCARISLHTYDRQNKWNIINSI
jgi:hypothetical protein